MLKNFLVGLLVIAFFTGCLKGGNGEFKCNYDDCAVKAPASEIQSVKDYLAANNLAASEHCSGLFYIITEQGTGATPTVCGAVKAIYEGKLTDGTVFAPKDTASFYLNEVIRGWANGIPLVKGGGKIQLFIPPTLGYGNTTPQGSTIPPNSILVFDVKVEEVY
jgi:FKBP-type peptidyl-prolyl cis-trans isomerase FkpA